VTRVLQRDGNPTPLGEAIKHCGRIHESLRIIPLIDDESYGREVKWIRNLKEGRHAHARKVFHGSTGELYQRYREARRDAVVTALVLAVPRTAVITNSAWPAAEPLAARGTSEPLAVTYARTLAV
jgi:TnpA family transposase